MLTFEKVKIRKTIIDYIPSDTFMGDIKEINSGNFKSKQFDGEVSFKNPKDNYTMVWVLSKGVVNKKLKRTESITKQKKTSKTATSLGYVCGDREIEYEICVGPGGEEVCTNYTYSVYECEWIEEPDIEENPYDCAVNNDWPWCQDGDEDPTDPENECRDLESTFDSSYGQSISEDINSVVTFDDSSSRTVRYTWRFYTGYGITLQSVDTGIHNRAHNHWEWVSITHESVYQTTDNSLFDVTHTINSVSAIVNNPKTATININFNVKAVLNCGGIALKTKEDNFTSYSVKRPYADGDQ
ncbi:hypothetical protein [Flavobacterium frigoris]|uniref:Uncharacterized protein n=1 Tax=Flavobacterium frigoris (strain PS1) TaxID=1086011 RepID=H7FQM8_FLAFP|nr:hypothetical protein [Flavobacterium frigoris]EIA09158.1 hypothetical protein HJ01_01544 [Flavobacterium frigoris PS1]